jgi:PAS domain S-box-containing protein
MGRTFENLPRVFEGRHTVFYLEEPTDEARPVLWKVLRDPAPSREAERLANEFASTKDISVAGMRRSLDYVRIDGKPALALEYVTGMTLRQACAEGPLGVLETLSVAISIARTLSGLHTYQVIHTNLTNDNVIVDRESSTATLIDFGMAVSGNLRSEHGGIATIQENDAFSYMSPEQSGRTNRPVDYRTDLYSLGLVMYEMLVGKLPFAGSSAPLELVHQHLAKLPESPRAVVPEIPAIVSDIIMKLLAKNPRNRYQSAAGLEKDLESCLRQWREKGTIDSFLLKNGDSSGELRLGRTLFGREAELRTLGEALDNAGAGVGEIVLVSGAEGVGKSALIVDIEPSVAERGGWFIAGSGDIFEQNTPHHAMIEAFTRLVDLILTESAEDMQRTKRNLALGGKARLLVETLPRLGLLIERRAVPGPVELAELQSAFLELVRVTARPGRPLVLFIDNLQWVDASTLSLLGSLLLDVADRHFLFVGAYRDNEIGPNEELFSAVLENLRVRGAGIRQLQLTNLSRGAVDALVCDALTSSSSEVRPLAELVYAKTAGSPIFTVQLLQSFKHAGLLAFDTRSRRWSWDEEKIRNVNVSDNVAAMMAEEIGGLPKEARHVLSLAACIGTEFGAETLALIAEKTPSETIQSLAPAIERGLVMSRSGADPSRNLKNETPETGRTTYEFSHIRLRQAAQSLISPKLARAVHLKIAEIRMQDLSPSEIDDRVFEIVDHFNKGFGDVRDEAGIVQLADLNLIAGRKAKRAAAYRESIWYLSMGIGMLPQDKWERHSDLCAELYREAIEAETLSGHLERVELLSSEVIGQARGLPERIHAYEARIRMFEALGRHRDGVDTWHDALRDIGLPLAHPREVEAAATRAEMRRLEANASALGSPGDLPECAFPHRDAVELLMTTYPCVCATYPNVPLHWLLVTVNLSLEHGVCPASAIGMQLLAAALLSEKGLSEIGHKLADGATATSERFRDASVRAEVALTRHTMVSHWDKPLSRAREELLDAHDEAAAAGDHQLATSYLEHYCMRGLVTGESLPALRASFDELERLRRDTNGPRSEGFEMSRRTVLHLLGETTQVWSSAELATRRSSSDRRTADTSELFELVVMGDWVTALRWVDAEVDRGASFSGAWQYEACFRMFLTALILLRGQSRAPVANPGTAARVAAIQTMLGVWADECPANYSPLYCLLLAEASHANNETLAAATQYATAVRAAREFSLTHLEALGCELEAEFHLAKGSEAEAGRAVEEACAAYRRWGAKRKVAQLENRHSKSGLGKAAGASSVLDIHTVIKATQAIAGEIELDRLLAQTLRILIENAGAETGCLVEVQNGRMTVLARGKIGVDGVETVRGVEVAGDEIPLTVVNYVARTLEPLVLDDASHDSTYASDRYIVANDVLSLLCLPIVRKGSLIAVLYLENNLSTHVFTADRLELLEVLSAQAAISMENAHLYSRLDVQIRELEQAEESLRLNFERSATLLKLNQMVEATVDEVVRFAFEEAVRLTKSKIGYLGFMNEEETVMTVEVRSRDVIPDCAVPDPLHFSVEGSGLWGEAIRQRRPIITNDYDAPNPWKRGYPEGHLKLVRHMNVPVIVGSRIVLVAGVGNKEEEYTETDVQQLTLLMEGMWRLLERRRAEDAVLAANARFRSVLRAATAYSIIGTDPDGLIQLFNEGSEIMLGYQAEEMNGRETLMAIHLPAEIEARAGEMGVEPGIEVLVAAAREGLTETREWTYVRKEGSHITVSLTVTAMRSETGTLTGFIGVARDITAERRMEQRLMQSQKMETVGMLAGCVAHDFNNLLMPILGYAEMLKEGFSTDDPRSHSLQVITKAAERARDLTHQLLAFGRKQIIELKTIDLAATIRSFEGIIRRTIRENIGIETRCEARASLVRADVGQIEHVLLNLLVNAQGAMPEGGVIVIEVENIDIEEPLVSVDSEISPGPYVVLSVSDTGVGMDEATMAHVFEPFFATHEMDLSTGLGLASVYGIVKQHGGSITVSSKRRQGSVFKIFLPRIAGTGRTTGAAIGPERAPARGIETILVVEDSEMVRKTTCEMLERLGYRVLSSSTAESCIELVRAHTGHIDLLLTDVIMPRMNGRELYDVLQGIRPELNVLFMSGYAADVIGRHGVADTGVRFIQKPFSLRVLSERVRQALDAERSSKL